MAKNRSIPGDSNFDISRFLDLDEEDKSQLENSEDFGLDSIALSKEEITTANVDTDLLNAIEVYIGSGRVPRAEKRQLRDLEAVNIHEEDEVKNLEAFIVSKASAYHSIVANFLKEKSELEQSTLDDEDPYSAENVSINEASSDSKAARTRAGTLFSELHSLEESRAKVNSRRREHLEEIITVASRNNLSGYSGLIKVVNDKISGIDKVQDVTRARITPEDEKNFEKDAEDFKSYMTGEFDPLAEDDDESYDAPLGDYVSNMETETPLSDVSFTEDEIRLIDSNPTTDSSESFSELFGVDTGSNKVVEEEDAPCEIIFGVAEPVPESSSEDSFEQDLTIVDENIAVDEEISSLEDEEVDSEVESDYERLAAAVSESMKPSQLAAMYAAMRATSVPSSEPDHVQIEAVYDPDYSHAINDWLTDGGAEFVDSTIYDLSAVDSENNGNNVTVVEVEENASPDLLEDIEAVEGVTDSTVDAESTESVEYDEEVPVHIEEDEVEEVLEVNEWSNFWEEDVLIEEADSSMSTLESTVEPLESSEEDSLVEGYFDLPDSDGNSLESAPIFDALAKEYGFDPDFIDTP